LIVHLEPMLDQAVASLRAGLPGVIDAINTQATDFTLPKPNDKPGEPDDGYVLGGWTIISYPVVEVAAPDWVMTNFSLAQVQSDLNPTVAVRAQFLKPESESGALYRMAMRYTTAVVQVLVQPDAFGAGITVQREGGIRGTYGFNPETNERQEVTGASIILFSLEMVDGWP
jgi:hypothetical protein